MIAGQAGRTCTTRRSRTSSTPGRRSPSVGLTERQVKESGREYRTGKFPFSANGRARSMGEATGFVKFVADAKTDELLGAHMVGPNVSELIAEVVLGVRVSGLVGGHRHHGARAPHALRGDEGGGACDARAARCKSESCPATSRSIPARCSPRTRRDTRACSWARSASRRISTARSKCWRSPSAGNDPEHRALVIARDGTVAGLALFGTIAGTAHGARFTRRCWRRASRPKTWASG